MLNGLANAKIVDNDRSSCEGLVGLRVHTRLPSQRHQQRLPLVGLSAGGKDHWI